MFHYCLIRSMSTAMCYILFLLSPFVTWSSGTPVPTHMLVIRVGPCEDVQQTIITVSEFSITTRSYDVSLTGNLNVSQDINNGWTIKATMQKCVDIRNMDTCDFFKSFSIVNNGCGENDDEAEIYRMLFHYAKPNIDCPIKAGRYKIEEYPYFSEDNYLTVYESKISTSVFGYTLKMEGFTDELEKIFCIEIYLQLLYMRNHDWLNHTTSPETIKPKNIAKYY